MGSEPDAEDDAACCSCDCHGRRFSSPSWRRCVKRKLEEMEEEGVRGVGLRADATARVEVENEAAALREALASHQQTVAELWEELEEERAASATAASETMSMILRLQREKAEAQMEARQFKRFAEEKMAHDQQELVALEDLLYKREQALQALSCEVQAYRHRLLSYGIPPDSVDPAAVADAEAAPEVDDAGAAAETPMYEYQSAFEYPQLRCQDNHQRLDPSFDNEDADDLDVYPSGATPRAREQLQNLEQRIHRLERTQSRSSTVLEMEKGVVMGQSPCPVRTGHPRQLSADTFASPLAREQQMCNGKQSEVPTATTGRSPDGGDDDSINDRVYTVDAVHRGAASPQAPTARACEDYVSTPREAVCRVDIGGDGQQETDIKKLYMRLEALEADRESMRQALFSMRTDKAQLVLLKEIAQHLYRDASSPSPPPPGRKLVKKPTTLGTFSFVSMVKWILSLVFWKRRSQGSKHIVGLSSSNAGLLLLLDKGPRMRQWRCLSRIQG
ncbi:hypothetical protein Taro_013929 [Colocasia esculenta]|uniref:GTD-binding domain-containing protein n=1 Tax=Colocasia esculenta TaxID=4460 RepID=A0A843UHI0_COLES|nr:hypothetical protein [Colocasia esculenta]